jgi:hypothetical protein
MKKFIALALTICGLSAPLSAVMQLDVSNNGEKLRIGILTSGTDRLSYQGDDDGYSRELNRAVDLFTNKNLIKTIEIVGYSFLPIENPDEFFGKFENLESLEITCITGDVNAFVNKLDKLQKSEAANKIKRLKLSGWLSGLNFNPMYIKACETFKNLKSLILKESDSFSRKEVCNVEIQKLLKINKELQITTK